MLHLGQTDGIWPGTDGRLQILCQPGGIQPVYPDYDILARRAVVPHGVVDQKPCRVLALRGDRVLQIVDDTVLVIETGVQHLARTGASHI